MAGQKNVVKKANKTKEAAMYEKLQKSIKPEEK